MKIGDNVYIDGYTSMAQQNARTAKVDDIQTRYDELTGKPFDIVLVDGDWYDTRDGGCHSNKNSMYYIEFEDALTDYLKSEKFQNDFEAQVKKDTWGNGIPMIYMDEQGNIISHWEDGTKDILDRTHPLIKERFSMDMSGSAPVLVEVVFVSTSGYVTTKYLSSSQNRFERFIMDDFKFFSGWKEN
jgi:hypothetical protein